MVNDRAAPAESQQLSGPTMTVWGRVDAVTVLTVYVVLMYVIPSDRRVGPLGGAGSVAGLFGAGMLLWWCWHHLQRPDPWARSNFQLVRAACFVFGGVVLASYAASAQMAVTPLDGNMADMGLIRVAGLLGVGLVANDGIRDEQRFVIFIRRCCTLIGLYAALGLVQFFTGVSWVDAIQIPGLTSTGAAGVELRQGFVRADATAMHPLEYATVLAMFLPFCLTLAIYDKHRSAFMRWFPVATITFSTVLSVTRSALIGVAAVFVVLFPSWPAKVRNAMALALVSGGLVVYLVVPGMGNAITTMFLGEDSSVDSRVNGYGTVMAFAGVNPWFGRGFGTFLPSYRILDNQFLVTLIETGIIGLVSVLLIFMTILSSGIAGNRRLENQPMRALGVAFAASAVAGALIFGFFDAFAFPQACNTLFLVAGLAGAYWNIAVQSRHRKVAKQ
jgi:polysaccharide biosynthesis protein PslJ